MQEELRESAVCWAPEETGPGPTTSDPHQKPKPAGGPKARPSDESATEPHNKIQRNQETFFADRPNGPRSTHVLLLLWFRFVPRPSLPVFLSHLSFAAAADLVLLFTRSFHLAASAVENSPEVLPRCSQYVHATTPTTATAHAAALNCGDDGGALFNMCPVWGGWGCGGGGVEGGRETREAR